MLRTPALFLVALAAAAAIGAPVASASGDDVIRDCIAVTLKPHYPADDYRDALENMPSDVDEYSDCRAQILAAQQADANGPKASAARATAQPAGGSSPVGPNTVARSAATAGPSLTQTTPVATTPRADIQEFDESVPGEYGAFTSPVAGPPVADEHRQRAPLVPIVIAFAVIVATGARLLARWGARPDAAVTTAP